MYRNLLSINKICYVEPWLLISVFSVAALLLTFGFIADEVMEGTASAFDRYVILAFRSSADNFANPIGPHG